MASNRVQLGRHPGMMCKTHRELQFHEVARGHSRVSLSVSSASRYFLFCLQRRSPFTGSGWLVRLAGLFVVCAACRALRIPPRTEDAGDPSFRTLGPSLSAIVRDRWSEAGTGGGKMREQSVCCLDAKLACC